MAACFQCGKQLPAGQELKDDKSGFTFCASCAPAGSTAVAAPPTTAAPVMPPPAPSAGAAPSPSLANALDASTQALQRSATVPRAAAPTTAQGDRINYLGAIAAGLGAGLVAGFIWYLFVSMTHFLVGYLAVGVGFVVAFGVVIGSGGNHGWQLQIISCALTLLTMIGSEYQIMRYFIAHSELGAMLQLPVVPPPDVLFVVVKESLGATPLTLLFWGVALFIAFRVPSSAVADDD